MTDSTSWVVNRLEANILLHGLVPISKFIKITL